MKKLNKMPVAYDESTTVTKATSKKIKARIKFLGLDFNYAMDLIKIRYKVHNSEELTEAQAQSFLEHLEGYGDV